MNELIHSGRVWVLLDRDNHLIEDIDTDQIYHNAFLYITERSLMGQYALGNLEGWKDFPQKAGPGDIMVAGRNFGAGSSRQQAVECFMALKLGLIIAPSFGAIYFRNAVNSGFPVLRCADIKFLVDQESIRNGDEIKIDLCTGEGMNLTRSIPFRSEAISMVQRDILIAGGLFEFARRMKQE